MGHSMLLLVGGFAVLVAGAELLVRGASQLARAAGVPALMIGLTVVAYGTSAPELAVSVTAGLEGRADIALGNVVGSNIFNLLFVLGVSALVTPLLVSSQLVRVDVPVMIAVSALAWLAAADGRVGRGEGVAMAAGLVAYTALLVVIGRRTPAAGASQPAPAAPPAACRPAAWPASVVLIAVGLGLLVLGAQWLVSGAVNVARLMGVSELVIGLTIVGAGTSLPELATSVVASIRGERDIAIGNIVGSNIFNLLAVLGASAAVTGGVEVAPAALRFDVPIMVAAAVACLPVFFTGGRISRWEGALFLAYYVAYVVYLVLTASRSASLPALGTVVMGFALPATALGIGLSVFYALRRRSRR